MILASVGLSATWTGCENTAQRIDVLFGVGTPEYPRNIVLDKGPHHQRRARDGSMRPLLNYFGQLFGFSSTVILKQGRLNAALVHCCRVRENMLIT